MRKMLVTGILAAVAIMMVPVASASAETVTGSCTIKGSANFKPALGPLLAEVKFKFKGTAECKVGAEEKEAVSGNAEVSGEGELACAVAEGGEEVLLKGKAAGKGKLELSKNGKAPFEKNPKFELRFKAAAGLVLLKIKPEGEAGEATGLATFVLSKEELGAKCATGVENLEFVAVAKGTV